MMGGVIDIIKNNPKIKLYDDGWLTCACASNMKVFPGSLATR